MSKILLKSKIPYGVEVTIPVGLTAEELLKQDPESIIVDSSDIDDKFIFVDAMILNGNQISFYLPKAKEIQKDRFRFARKPILEKLDIEFMKALESGNTQKVQEIATKKQELRDVTNIPLPDDIEGIKNTWPSILNL